MRTINKTGAVIALGAAAVAHNFVWTVAQQGKTDGRGPEAPPLASVNFALNATNTANMGGTTLVISYRAIDAIMDNDYSTAPTNHKAPIGASKKPPTA